jgi:hypothetical protein
VVGGCIEDFCHFSLRPLPCLRPVFALLNSVGYGVGLWTVPARVCEGLDGSYGDVPGWVSAPNLIDRVGTIRAWRFQTFCRSVRSFGCHNS